MSSPPFHYSEEQLDIIRQERPGLDGALYLAWWGLQEAEEVVRRKAKYRDARLSEFRNLMEQADALLASSNNRAKGGGS